MTITITDVNATTVKATYSAGVTTVTTGEVTKYDLGNLHIVFSGDQTLCGADKLNMINLL